jgi:hypothetical protein
MPRRLWITFRFGQNVAKATMTPKRIREIFQDTRIKNVSNGFAFLADPDERLQDLMEEAWREIAKHDGVLLDIAVTVER